MYVHVSGLVYMSHHMCWTPSSLCVFLSELYLSYVCAGEAEEKNHRRDVGGGDGTKPK